MVPDVTSQPPQAIPVDDAVSELARKTYKKSTFFFDATIQPHKVQDGIWKGSVPKKNGGFSFPSLFQENHAHGCMIFHVELQESNVGKGSLMHNPRWCKWRVTFWANLWNHGNHEIILWSQRELATWNFVSVCFSVRCCENPWLHSARVKSWCHLDKVWSALLQWAAIRCMKERETTETT